MPGEQRASERRINAAEKQAQAIELRKAGATYDQIARKVGYSNRGSACRAVQKALEKITEEPALELRALVSERLDTMLLGVWQQARSGHLGAIDRALKIEERRAKLFGLDKQAETEITVNSGIEYSSNLDELVDEYMSKRKSENNKPGQDATNG